MERFSTLVRERNIMLFLSLPEEKTLRAAARRCDIAYKHAQRLVVLWMKAGWMARRPTLHGMRYFYSVEGAAIASVFQDVAVMMRGR